jgi:dipeptidase E
MKLLLTSSGIKNASIEKALVELLGKPIAEANALFVPTGIHPFPGSPIWAWQAIGGKHSTALCQLGWKSLGLLELTALPSIDTTNWRPSLEAADALLVWGGDPLYLSYWMKESGVADRLPALWDRLVYVGVSAGSMMVATTFAETYSRPRAGAGVALTSQAISLPTPQGDIDCTLMTGAGLGLIDFALIPHFDHADHPDASPANAARWAAALPVPVYAIDDQSAIKVVGKTIEVVSEGRWQRFDPMPA